MAPMPFSECVKNGGKVVTKSLKGNRYIKICYDKNGKSYSGKVQLKKKDAGVDKKSNRNKEKSYIKEAKAQVVDLLKLKECFDNKRN